MLGPAIARITALFSKAPRAVTADRGYGEAKVEAELHELGVKTSPSRARDDPVLPRQGSSRRGGSATSSSGAPDRKAYLAPQALLGLGAHHARRHRRGAHVVRLGLLAHNATKIAVLIDEREQGNGPAPSPSEARTSAGPPGRPPPPSPVCLPDLAPTLSCRVPPPETAGKWGQKRPERSGREPMGERGGHSGQLGNRTETGFSGEVVRNPLVPLDFPRDLAEAVVSNHRNRHGGRHRQEQLRVPRSFPHIAPPSWSPDLSGELCIHVMHRRRSPSPTSYLRAARLGQVLRGEPATPIARGRS